jgi:hypothetical protein
MTKKKLISLFVAASLLVSLFAAMPTVSAQSAFQLPPPGTSRPLVIQDAIHVLQGVARIIDLPLETYDFNKNGVIDIQDAILCLRGVARQIPLRLEVPYVASFEGLCGELEHRIKEAWLWRHYNFPERYDVRNVQITHFFGIYNDSVVVMMRDNNIMYLDYLRYSEVAGYVFAYRNAGPIWIFNDGELHTLERRSSAIPGAYESGLLTEQDVGEISLQHRQAFPLWYCPMFPQRCECTDTGHWGWY